MKSKKRPLFNFFFPHILYYLKKVAKLDLTSIRNTEMKFRLAKTGLTPILRIHKNSLKQLIN